MSNDPTSTESTIWPPGKRIEWAWMADIDHPSERLVLLYLATAAKSYPPYECWPPLETVAIKTGCNEKTVRRAITKLKEYGWIEAYRKRVKGRRSFTYSLLRHDAESGHDAQVHEGKVGMTPGVKVDMTPGKGGHDAQVPGLKVGMTPTKQGIKQERTGNEEQGSALAKPGKPPALRASVAARPHAHQGQTTRPKPPRSKRGQGGLSPAVDDGMLAALQRQIAGTRHGGRVIRGSEL